MQTTLDDPEYAIDHTAARNRIALATRTIETCNQLIAAQLNILGILDEKEEIERQLAALEEDHIFFKNDVFLFLW